MTGQRKEQMGDADRKSGLLLQGSDGKGAMQAPEANLSVHSLVTRVARTGLCLLKNHHHLTVWKHVCRYQVKMKLY